MNLTIDYLKKGYRNATFSPREIIGELLNKCQKEDPAIWIHLLDDKELEPYLQRLEQVDPQSLPLYGIPFGIKDNIDLAGVPTTAGCPGYSYIAGESAFVVDRLVESGALPIGKTNMDQFATGLVGTRTPYGIPSNSFNKDYIPGGSSSGSAVAVAKGLCTFSLGTDTAGSGRIPAAFNNILGIKPTRGLLSTRGVVPACRTLDCVSLFTLCGGDAATIMEIVAAHDPNDPFSRREEKNNPAAFPSGEFTFGVPGSKLLEFYGNEEYRQSFIKATELLEQLGGNRIEIDFAPFLEAARLLYEGPWVEERTLAVGESIEANIEGIHPVTRKIICGRPQQSARELFDAIYRLQTCKQRGDAILDSVDLLVTPTAGTSYTIQELLEDPITLNSNLGYYTNYMNLLDYCSLAVPITLTSTVPFGVSLVAPSFSDRQLLSIGARLHQKTGMKMGLSPFLPDPLEVSDCHSHLTVAVCGAHLKGLPLHHQLEELKARFLTKTATTPCYRMYALGGAIEKPGLIRDEDDGREMEVELYSLSPENFGRFVAAIPHPLGIGKLQLRDGSWVPGFIAEPVVAKQGTDITRYCGWRNYLAA